ncbi:MAG TPA: GNAT family N-acetyltransferase [Micromonosporaceae bacterium]|nr:GNAT family N-acetyltransferase [Micromonosporaceae bacterium]
MNIRRITPEERLTLSLPVQAYAFGTSPASADERQRWRAHLPYSTGNTTLVAFDGDAAQAAASAVPMRQNVRGAVLPMAGIAGVAAHPLARRRGHVRALLTRLLAESRDAGNVVSALYPFRASFYARFGYVGLPQVKRTTLPVRDLAPLLGADLPGEVRLERIKEGYAAYRGLTERLVGERHGFALAPDYRAVRLRDEDERWLVTARVDGELVGASTYRIIEHGGDLLADDLLYTTPLGRAMLLQFFARHVDQVGRVVLRLAPDEQPELWLTDLGAHSEIRTSYPDSPAPMARVLSVEGLAALDVGPGLVEVEVVDDALTGGRYLLDGTAGKLEVAAPSGGSVVPLARLTVAGLSALVYGVLDPAEVAVRALGEVPADAAAQLAALFDRRIPFLFTEF